MTVSVMDLIKSALRVNNSLAVSETPDADTISDSLLALNIMLDEWSATGLVVYQDEQQQFNIIANQDEYTIGQSGSEDWTGNRPIVIRNAVIIDGDFTYPMSQVNLSDYMNIPDKNTTGRPYIFYYEPSMPDGTVHLYPEPDKSYIIEIANRIEFDEYESDDTITLPQGYLAALKYNLALELAGEFESIPNDWLLKRAHDTLSKVKRINLKKSGSIKYDDILMRNGYDINNDRWGRK